ncbi:hypothetical protein BGZ95_008481 [Linnemannia exigua]|uniref:Uncharacterized protein n=1 Tax=Linnemannia exigua TaxID=604196 RepID=A0AAD4DEK3_9FUNG|nr:hypothetical protein BGZ95_008481 [Linnemannia exigua]
MVCLLSPSRSAATTLLSCLAATSVVVVLLSTESVGARPLAQDSVVLLSEEARFIAVGQGTTLSRPARLQDDNKEEGEVEGEGGGLVQSQRQRQQQQQLYDIQPVFVVDQTEFDVYLGTYPDKRPRPLNASAKRRKKKKKKKKKPVLPAGQGQGHEEEEGVVVVQEEEASEAIPVQGRQYRGPVYDQKSLSGFRMKAGAVESPWRYRMSYLLEWTVDADLREQIGRALTRAETMRWEQAGRRHNDVDQDVTTAPVPEMAEEQRLREGSKLMMDFLLVPLDQVKSNELLLTRVPVSSQQAMIQLRPEVLEGWYRLQIQFWEEPDLSLQECTLFGALFDDNDISKDEDATESRLLSSPGRLKDDVWGNNCFPRQVGVWRSAEAIEVTDLGPKDLEWKEFIETLSRETRQEQWSLEEFPSSSFSSLPLSGILSGERALGREQHKAILQEEHVAIEEFREPRPVVVLGNGVGSRWDLGLGRLSGLHHRIKGFLGDPWGFKAASSRPGPPATPQQSSTPPSRQSQERSSYKRTIFPQDMFRYQEYVGPNIKDVVPDFLVQELEEFEDAALEALELQQERIQQWWKKKQQVDQKEQVGEEDEEEAAVVIYPMSVWNPEIARLEKLMGVWNDDAVLRKESKDVVVEEVEEEEGLILEVQDNNRMRGLSPRIWQGAIETDSTTVATWRSNQDRIVSWQIPLSSSSSSSSNNNNDDDSSFLLDIELVATPAFQLQQDQDHTKSSPITTGWTRDSMTQAALHQQYVVALLTDRIPVTWGAMQVQMPAWVPTGTYHIRVRDAAHGGRGGGVVEDVSQPFVVLSDPYLYSYS